MKVVVGIDEVGRGPVAGPVAVGAFLIFDDGFDLHVQNFSIPLRDSKQLTRVQREAWYEHIETLRDKGMCDFVVSMVPANLIDLRGITHAIRSALAECLELLECTEDALVLLDGSLRAPARFKNQITMIKGDEKEMAISLASIVAKVTRDRHMQKLAVRYPQYGFEQHVGYGTEQHYAAIKKHGLTPIHRKTFLLDLPEVRRDRRLVDRIKNRRKIRR
jgi:ribonuclease HII